MTSRPRVYARLRPQSESELRQGGEQAFSAEKGHKDCLVFEKDGELVKTRFDYVFDIGDTQESVFGKIGVEVVDTLFSGYNASVFAYGQTGSGKTFTMEGDWAEAARRGLVPRTIQLIFERFRGNPEITDPIVEVSIVQIYQERIQDLLQSRKNLEIHLDRTGQYIAQGANWKSVYNVEEAMSVYFDAVKQRAVTATEMNLVSSRSHLIMMLKLQWDEPTLPGSRAQLNLIDLAGSEKLHQSGATGEAMKEAISINKSLSALGNVVSKLVDAVKQKDRRVHVPYKDSKLTYLLQSSLGGANLVHFLLAVSSSSLWRAESFATVEFGKRALQLVLRPVRNPIDYKRLEEMEAMIEKMRNHIRSLEEELKGNKNQPVTFLQIKQLHQDGEAPGRRAVKKVKSGLKSKTELNRIIANLPETLEDLTSHCVLFPESKATFRQLGGLLKLIHYIDKSPSTFYKAHAAHTLAHVLDDEGHETFGANGGIEALTRLLHVKEERCKEAAAVAIEAVVRNCRGNKVRVSDDIYSSLVELMFGNANQQVQEAAITALASLVDSFPEAKVALERLHVDLVKKLVQIIRETPAEVVHIAKAATTCLGRLAHGDTKCQEDIARLGGISVLIENVLFSPIGDRDHQIPILASYALVNVACSNPRNMTIVKQHPRFEEVRFRLMEGLARAFGQNTVREGFARATAQETAAHFPYFGVTVTDKWTRHTCGGRPIFPTFMENPQFYLFVTEETKISLLIQDVLYEARMQQKQKNNTVYMGLAVFQGDAELARLGLKQLDFHGKMTEIAKFTSNCENVLHCTLKRSEVPYILVPFTSQRGRTTTFALSAFGDKKIDLTAVPENAGWIRHAFHGSWNTLTARSGDGLDWRNNPQIRFTVKEKTKAVFVLSYLSLDEQRKLKRDDTVEEEKQNLRPRLHGRVFTNNFAPSMRYVKSLVPLPQHSTFVASNTFSSNSYITTTAELQAGQSYVYIPFTEAAHEDTFRVCMYTDSEEIEFQPPAISSKPDATGTEMQIPSSEWTVHSFGVSWKAEPLRIAVTFTGKLCVIVSSKDTFVRPSIFSSDEKRLAGIDSFWNGEGSIEYSVTSSHQVTVTVCIEGMVKVNGTQQPPSTGKADVYVFATDRLSKAVPTFSTQPASATLLSVETNPLEIDYPVETPDLDGPEEGESDESEDDGVRSEVEPEGENLRGELETQRMENRRLSDRLLDAEKAIEKLKTTQSVPSSTPPGRESFSVAATPTLPPSRSGSIGSRQGSRAVFSRQRSWAGETSATPPLAATPQCGEIARSLGMILSQDKVPSPLEWARIRKELKECQLKLLGLSK